MAMHFLLQTLKLDIRGGGGAGVHVKGVGVITLTLKSMSPGAKHGHRTMLQNDPRKLPLLLPTPQRGELSVSEVMEVQVVQMV